jgi:hypothetical protein
MLSISRSRDFLNKEEVEKRLKLSGFGGKKLGVGSCRVVYLETTDDGWEKAIKSIRKSLAANLRIDYRRELLATSTFSKAKVNYCFFTAKSFLRVQNFLRHSRYPITHHSASAFIIPITTFIWAAHF